MQEQDVRQCVEKQRRFFRTGVTRPVKFREAQLLRLADALVAHERALYAALREDLDKSVVEAFGSEYFGVHREAEVARKKVGRWSRPRRVSTPWLLFPGRAERIPEPYGNVLVISPWNYPFSLSLLPLIGAMAAGNTVLLKPSELAPNSSALLTRILGDTFDPEYIAVIEGGPEEATCLLEQRFDYIFFTGGERVGRIVMQAAAKHLTPLTLELGGKSPCVVHRDANLRIAARRIVWGKGLNAGQTCIAPDYLLVDQSVREEFVSCFRQELDRLYSASTWTSDTARIINPAHFERLVGLLEGARILAGGQVRTGDLRMALTLVDQVDWEHPVMQEEIFGPILPLLTYDDIDDAINTITRHPKPLAFYAFTMNRSLARRIVERVSAGGLCVNDTLGQYINTNLPFGGVGNSGIGAYHKQASFDLFSHFKSVQYRSCLDLPVRYPPYETKFKTIRRLFKHLG